MLVKEPGRLEWLEFTNFEAREPKIINCDVIQYASVISQYSSRYYGEHAYWRIIAQTS